MGASILPVVRACPFWEADLSLIDLHWFEEQVNSRHMKHALHGLSGASTPETSPSVKEQPHTKESPLQELHRC